MHFPREAAHLGRICHAAAQYKEVCSHKGSDSALVVLRDVGRGEEAATKEFGLSLTAAEVEAVLIRVNADLRLLALDDDSDLAEPAKGPRKVLPWRTIEALRWLAWHESWLAALSRAASGEHPVLSNGTSGLPLADFMKLPVRARFVEKAKAQWFQSTAELGSDQEPFLPNAAAELLASAACAIAQHYSAVRVRPTSCSSTDGKAKEAWLSYTTSITDLKTGQSAALSEELLESLVGILQNSAWHATNLVFEYQEADDDHDENEDEETEDFGAAYIKIQDNAQTNLVCLLRCVVESYWGSPPSYSLGKHWRRRQRWRGLCFTSGQPVQPAVIQSAADAGFNAIRLAVNQTLIDSQTLTESLGPILDACSAADIDVVLDLSGWSLRSRRQDGIRGSLGKVASAVVTFSCVRGLVLPRVPLHSLPPLVAEIRARGLSAERCAAIVLLDDPPIDTEGNYAGMLSKALSEGEQGLLLGDGHIVFEMRRRLKSLGQPFQVLNEASRAHIGINDYLPLGCIKFDLEVPNELTQVYDTLGWHWWEELAARQAASASTTSHGWFASLDDESFNLCLGRYWSWPNPDADRVLWPHGTPHIGTLVFFDDHNGDADAFLRCPDYFTCAIPSGEEEQNEKVYMPVPGFKIVIPVQAARQQPAYGGGSCPSWYSYTQKNNGVAEDELNMKTIEETARCCHQLLDTEGRLVESTQIFVGGLGQGCTAALHVALTYPKNLGGIIAGQGHLASCTQVPADWASRNTPIFVCHGLANDRMPWEAWVASTYDRIKQVGAEVRIVTRMDVNDGDKEAEIAWVRSFIMNVWEGAMQRGLRYFQANA